LTVTVTPKFWVVATGYFVILSSITAAKVLFNDFTVIPES